MGRKNTRQSVSMADGDDLKASSPVLDFKSFRKELVKCISRKSGPGSFAFWTDDLCNINPGLNIDGLGSVALPIHEAEAKRIIQFATKAPYGKGTETIVDENVRKTWEIDSQNITFKNPGWAQWLDGALSQVKRGLGLKTETVRAELYKLLIYSPGAHFKPHRDTEKTRGMFGTLVVCLPSPHEGGDIRLLHGNEEEIFSTSSTSEFDMSCVAWYSDVLHEVMPVTSGHRVVLTYNLTLSDASFSPSADAIDDSTRMLTRLFNRYAANAASNDNLPSELIYRLDHKYTQANFGIKNLKRSDKSALKRLQAATEGTCEIYFGLLEREVSGACNDDEQYFYDYYEEFPEEDESDEDEEEDEIDDDDGSVDSSPASLSSEPYHKITDPRTVTSLKHVVTLDGKLIADELHANPDSFIQDIYKNRQPDEEDHEGYTGNEGGSTTHWYDDAVLILVPKKFSCTFKLGPCLENQALLPALVDSLLQRIDQQDSQAQEELATLCKVCLKKVGSSKSGKYSSSIYNKKPIKRETQGALAHACAATQSPRTFRQITEFLDRNMPTDCFELMGRRFQMPESKQAKCLQSLKDTILKLSFPAERFDALNNFKSGYYATHSDQDTAISDFVRGSMGIVVDIFRNKYEGTYSARTPSYKDGYALISVLSRYNRIDLEPRVLEKAQQATSITGATIGLLLGLLDAYHNDHIWSHDRLISIFFPIYDNFIRHFDLTEGIRSIHPGYVEAHPMRQESSIIECNANLAQKTAQLYSQCIRTDGVLEIHLLDTIATKYESKWSVEGNISFLEHFLPELLKVLHENSLQYDSHNGLYQNFFQRVVWACVQNHVGQKPLPPPDWSRERVKCNCDYCKDLNRFLRDKKQISGFFAMNEKRRRHLSYELDRINGRHYQSTEHGKPSYVLVVTKNNKEHETIESAWSFRVKQVDTILRRINSETLRGLLGDQFFKGKQFSVLQSLSLQSPSEARRPLANTDANARINKRGLGDEHTSPQSAKRRHVDVIDLTE